MSKKGIQRDPPKHYPKNPRKITPTQLHELEVSLRELGDLSGIIFNRATSHLVGGNQRTKILKFSWDDVEIIEHYNKPDQQGTVAWGFITWEGSRYNFREVHWPPEIEDRANIVANKLGGEWDNAILKEFFTVEQLKLWGFNRQDLRWLNERNAFKHDDQVFNSLKIHTDPGDFYELNDHRILCADATDPAAWRQMTAGRIIDATITDPPYNVNYHDRSHHSKQIVNDNMPDAEYLEFLNSWLILATEYMAPGAAWYLFHPDSRGEIFRRSIREAGNYLAQVLIWVKNHHVRGHADYHWKHEPILYAFKQKPELEAALIKWLKENAGDTYQIFEQAHEAILYGWRKGAPHIWMSDRKQQTVLDFDKPLASREHPTMKPVALIEYLINNSTFEKAIVCDCFIGSGSTIIAADKQGRTCLGMELEPRHVDSAIIRWVQHRKKTNQPWQVKRNGKKVNEIWVHGDKETQPAGG